MTKRFHKCDETCKINHKPVKKIDTKPKIKKKFVETDFGNIPIDTKTTLKMKPEVVNVYKLSPKTDNMIEIIHIVDEINNSIETNKALEKTLITLRKLQKDIA